MHVHSRVYVEHTSGVWDIVSGQYCTAMYSGTGHFRTSYFWYNITVMERLTSLGGKCIISFIAVSA